MEANIVKNQITLRGYSDEYAKEYIKKDGTILPIAIRVWLIKDEEGKPAGMWCIARDITEHKRAEEKLITYQKQLRSLASQLSLAEERQRRQIALGLHDSIGQALAICKVKLGAIRTQPSSTTVVGPLDEVYEIIEKVIQEVRSLIFEVSPPILYELGLEAAVEWLTEEMTSKHGVHCSFEDDGQFKALSEDIRVLLFQTVRELLANITRHAQANNAEVYIKRSGNNMQIEVRDDGVGFDIKEARSHAIRTHAFGLFSISERIGHIGGHCNIDSSPAHGTRVIVAVPLGLAACESMEKTRHEHKNHPGR
ncbi:ATP-binding protein [Chloroflexota bacterium]